MNEPTNPDTGRPRIVRKWSPADAEQERVGQQTDTPAQPPQGGITPEQREWEAGIAALNAEKPTDAAGLDNALTPPAEPAVAQAVDPAFARQLAEIDNRLQADARQAAEEARLKDKPLAPGQRVANIDDGLYPWGEAPSDHQEGVDLSRVVPGAPDPAPRGPIRVEPHRGPVQPGTGAPAPRDVQQPPAYDAAAAMARQAQKGAKAIPLPPQLGKK